MKFEFEEIREVAVPESWIVSYWDHDSILTEKEMKSVEGRGADESGWRAYVQAKNLGKFVCAHLKEEV